jgi:hypothetical protein
VGASNLRSLDRSPRIGILLHLDLDGTKLLSSSARVEVPRRAFGTRKRDIFHMPCVRLFFMPHLFK